jgi:hypothetical protein
MESKNYERHSETITIPLRMLPYAVIFVYPVDGDGLVVPSWLALWWIAQGSGFESQRGHLFFGISHGGRYHRSVLPRGWFPLLP